MKTIGWSPKAIAAAITAYIATIVTGFLATKIGVDISVDTATVFLGPLVLAGVTLLAARFAPPGIVVPKDYLDHDPLDEDEVPEVTVTVPDGPPTHLDRS